MTPQRSAPPRQAVILAGGRGTRLAPITDTIPKPMVPFHGRPFLEYLVEMLAAEGIERILLLLGYLPEPIMEHFGDGSRFGVTISYNVTAVTDDTGRRLRLARDRLDPTFLLMYCDNYWPMDLKRLWAHHLKAGRRAQVTVYANEDGYSRDNLIVDEEGLLVRYDKSRTTPGLQGVDIGFLLLDRELIDALPSGNVSLEAELYPRLIAERELSAFVTHHRYYSVGTPARLPMTANFLARHPTVILDRDGVLNVRPPRACYVTAPEDFTWLPGAREALRRLKDAGIRCIVVTNQPGIARGALTAETLSAIHERMCREAAAAGGEITRIYHCPHGWDEGCACRKPNPGMLFQAQRDFDLDLSRTWFLGDDERDELAARRAGARFAMVSERRPLLRIVTEEILPHFRRRG